MSARSHAEKNVRELIRKADAAPDTDAAPQPPTAPGDLARLAVVEGQSRIRELSASASPLTVRAVSDSRFGRRRAEPVSVRVAMTNAMSGEPRRDAGKHWGQWGVRNYYGSRWIGTYMAKNCARLRLEI